MPLVIVVAFLLASVFGSSPSPGNQNGPLPTYSASAPPRATQNAAVCNKLIENLPVQLEKLKPRVVTPNAGPYVVAWGDPAIVVSCGVDKPASLTPGSSDQLIDAGGTTSGAYYDVTSQGDTQIYTAVDRAAFVSVAVPGTYAAASYLADINSAITKAMPEQVCSPDGSAPDPDTLCTRRK